MKRYGSYVNGEWAQTSGAQTFESINPTTKQAIAEIQAGTEEDLEAAVRAARTALPSWKRTPPPKRGEVLLRAAAMMRQRKDELGEVVTKEMGKVISEGRGDVQEAIDFLEYIAGEGRRMLGETTTSELSDKFCMTVRQPIGLVGCITPWNFPIAVPCWKLGAALISGNTVVFKPATLTPVCAAQLVEIFEQAGLPPGVLNLVTGSAEIIGKGIVEHPDVKTVSFTGGITAGKDVYTRASTHMKKVGLELGGKNPQIIMDDARIDLAIDGVLFAAFGTAGQRCTATSRLIVHERIYGEVVNMLLARTEALRIGDPLDPDVNVGPVCGNEQEDKILKYIDIGQREGAKLLTGGRKLTEGSLGSGFFIEPTIFETKHGMRLTKEEIFGPVLSVIKVGGYEDAIRVANDVDYGLSSSIYTQDIQTAYRAIDDLETGITYINAPTIGAEVHLPFGGVKGTGNGTREAGTTAIEEFTEIKTIFIDYSGKLQKAQIEE